MSDPRYLDVDTLISINGRFGGGVVDLGGVESCAQRPQSGAFGAEVFPDLWSKAAAYLHGIASTQYFADGNKRTAWVAANVFLDDNGFELPPIPDIEAETFVQAVAQGVFDTEDAPGLTVERAAEWFESKWRNQRVGPAQHPQLEYVFLAHAAMEDPQMPGTVHMQNAGFTGTTFVGDVTGVFPLQLPLAVIGRLHWTPVDPLIQHTLRAQFVPHEGYRRVNNGVITHSVSRAIPPSGHPQHQPTGLLPMIFHLAMKPVFLEPTECTVVVDIDGVRAAEIPFHIRYVQSEDLDIGLSKVAKP